MALTTKIAGGTPVPGGEPGASATGGSTRATRILRSLTLPARHCLLRHLQQDRPRRVFGVLSLLPSQKDERMGRRLHPRLTINNDCAGRFVWRNQNSIEADVEDADAVRQTAHLQRHPARELVAPLDANLQTRLTARPHRY